MIKYNKTIMKFESDGITLSYGADLTGWELKYLVKNQLGKDSESVLNITPQLVVVDDKQKIFIPFLASTLKDIKTGKYLHACKIIKDNQAITLFTGILTIKDEYIQYPEVI